MDLTPFPNTIHIGSKSWHLLGYRSFLFAHIHASRITTPCIIYIRISRFSSSSFPILGAFRFAIHIVPIKMLYDWEWCRNIKVYHSPGIHHFQPFPVCAHSVCTGSAYKSFNEFVIHISSFCTAMYRFWIEIRLQWCACVCVVLCTFYFIFHWTFDTAGFLFRHFSLSLIPPNPDWRHNAFLKAKCDVHTWCWWFNFLSFRRFSKERDWNSSV